MMRQLFIFVAVFALSSSSSTYQAMGNRHYPRKRDELCSCHFCVIVNRTNDLGGKREVENAQVGHKNTFFCELPFTAYHLTSRSEPSQTQ
jgi:hypothetical protein